MSDTKIPVEGVDCDQLHNYGNGYNNCNSVAIIMYCPNYFIRNVLIVSVFQ